MRFSILTITTVLLIAVSISSGNEKKNIKPSQHWGGIVNDDAKQKAAPKTGYFTKQEDFEKLWEVWGLKDKAPKLDFAKQIVFVQIASGPNSIGTSYTLKDGDLTALSRQTLKAGPGFGFGLDVLDRDGIKSYNGKPLEK